jgi:hypothetical protein
MGNVGVKGIERRFQICDLRLMIESGSVANPVGEPVPGSSIINLKSQI